MFVLDLHFTKIVSTRPMPMKPLSMTGIEEKSVLLCIALFWPSMTVRRVCLKSGGEAYLYYNIHTMHSGLQLH
jgi:hypothetical protein